MKREMVVLTRSDKHNNYCVAGITKNKGTWEWIRPVNPNREDGAITLGNMTYGDGTECKELDVVTIDCLDKDAALRHQPENVYINPNVKWHKKDCVSTWETLIDFFPPEECSNILNSRIDRIPASKMASIKDIRSLQLVHTSNLFIHKAVGTEHPKATFTYLTDKGEDIDYKLTVTDPDYKDSKTQDRYIGDAYLVVSLGEHYDKTNSHHLLIAKVIILEKKKKKPINSKDNAILYLIGLVKGVVCDGKITDDEVHTINQWLGRHTDLLNDETYVAIKTVVDKVLEDGVITKKEKKYMLTQLNDAHSNFEASFKETIKAKGHTAALGAKIITPFPSSDEITKKGLGNTELTKRAIDHIRSLEDGIDPVTQTALDAETLSRPQTRDCFLFIEKTLSELVEKKAKKKTKGLKPYPLERLKNFTYQGQSGIAVLLKRIKLLAPDDVMVLKAHDANLWLAEKGFIAKAEKDWIITNKGKEIGLRIEHKDTFDQVVYNKKAQLYVVDHFAEIMDYVFGDGATV